MVSPHKTGPNPGKPFLGGKQMKKVLLTSASVLLAASAASAETITVATVNNGHMINMQELTSHFTEATGIDVEWVTLDEGTLRQQVTLDAGTGGGAYDVFTIGMYEAPIWGDNGWIQALEFGADYDVNDILPAMAGGLSSNGNLYAAPFYGESSMVMYRADLAEAAGVSIADNDSWDNVKAAAAAMHDPDNGVYGACLRGKPGWGDNMAFITTVVNSFGGAWFDADGNPTIDTPEWNAAINFYVDLLSSYGPPGSEGNSFGEILTLYRQGQCAMWIDATIAASFLEGASDAGTGVESVVAGKVGYAQSPNAGNPVGANWLWAWALAVPAGTDNSAEALAFIEWATSKDYIQLVGSELGWGSVPTGTRASTYDIPEFQAVANFAAAELAAIDSAAPEATELKPYVGVQFAAIPEFQEIGIGVGEEMAAALSGAKSVEDALAASQAHAEAVMAASN